MSGYGTQAAALGRSLTAHGHTVGFAPFHGLTGTAIHFENMIVYPGSAESPWALDILPAHYQHFQADLLITVMDAWVLDPARLAGMNVAHWMPVDCEPMGGLDRRILENGRGRPVALSRFGEAQMKAAGFRPLYVPHALDMSLWAPLTARDEARKALNLDDRFVIQVNAANQDPQRKGIGEQLQAFKIFSDRHPDAVMLIHARGETAQGLNLPALITALGLEGRAILGDQYQIAAGLIPESQMAMWHGLGDVLSNCAWGEGFGLAVLQAQACGTPVVVTDCSAMSELCGAGWKVPGQRHWNRGHNAWWTIPYVGAIAEAYEEAYEKAAGMREQAREFALAYDAERVFAEFWEPALAELLPKRRGAAAGQRRIWSPVMLRNETDMLAMRFAETEGLVDRHVIVESGLTHRGVPKDLCWPKTGKRFARYARDVTFVTADLNPDVESLPDPEARRKAAWANEHAQRDAAWPVIDAEASDHDYVLICDLDEIPSREVLEKARRGELPEVCALRMNVTIHAVDWLVPAGRVPPQAVIATAGFIRRRGGSLAAVRDRRLEYPVIENAGWHFSWIGGPEAAREKLETATCHTELLTNGEGPLIADGTRYRTAENGGGLPVVPVDVDETWPKWIAERKCPPEWFRPREEAAVPA